METRVKKHKRLKGFSLVEALTISAVFLIVMIFSLTILINGWKTMTKFQTSSSQLRDIRESLARASILLREAQEIYYPDSNTFKSGTNKVVFTKNNDNLTSPTKEVFELAFNDSGRTLVLKKYNPAYPAKTDVLEERVIGKQLDNFNFILIQESNGVALEYDVIHIDATSKSENIKKPDIKLSTNVKLK